MKRFLWSLALASTWVMAAPAPTDFALRLPIEVPARTSLVAITLPADVYRVAQRGDLGDVRIVDAAGEAVPMAFVPPPRPPAERRAERALVPLPAARAEAGDPAVAVSAHSGGASVRVQIAGAPPADAGPAMAYLIDTAGFDETIDALELQWAGAPEFEAALRVRASDDLSDWQSATPRAVVLAAGAGAARIEHRRVRLPGVHRRYLRLEWLGAAPALTLTGVTLVHAATAAGPARAWIDLSGERDGDALRYVSPGLFPVEAASLVPAGPSDVLAATLWSRPQPSRRWTWRGSVLAYRLQQDGAPVESEAAHVIRTRDPLWRVQLRQGMPNGALPTLRLGWTPEQVVFVARGAGPFSLLAGNASAAPVWQPVGQVVPGFGTARAATIGAGRPGHASDTVTAAPRARSDWDDPAHWLLWGVLVLGVGALGWMARSLLRELSSGEGADRR
ncbi:DUF3999 domain-containing protein [Nitrogeniibacter mangrovi]|uniref:DUF3999 domain-containing protein n=1 Tax=Nitrogeniibacter mangrovi TaxID=2016596 RepID=A0A6C1AZG0_9RHOO|nr:DUF3999 family protein [Nitrogeniibacter mangrovi]QID16742.1 DUF3999 domain-containing protein [Nitrogeniibacter mangrovi]